MIMDPFDVATYRFGAFEEKEKKLSEVAVGVVDIIYNKERQLQALPVGLRRESSLCSVWPLMNWHMGAPWLEDSLRYDYYHRATGEKLGISHFKPTRIPTSMAY
jgi:hypothetical protein